MWGIPSTCIADPSNCGCSEGCVEIMLPRDKLTLSKIQRFITNTTSRHGIQCTVICLWLVLLQLCCTRTEPCHPTDVLCSKTSLYDRLHILPAHRSWRKTCLGLPALAWVKAPAKDKSKMILLGDDYASP
ncbi:uncharacterized protein Bfra_011862 [Botrytis fragariae]|uniref:Uncharacterized protein n=1 Tax=Botrytis fragariae TaxID=1964551 RepID=A0A8H6AJP3_9HELO|nr:uncharacterized protein Bfra_011862 [Botrytis fragariae]KAF5868897.1 hypothetical protein Bfra_011862 [Botrytis fragariae]